MIRSNLSCKKLFLAVILSFSAFAVFGSDRYSVASGNWQSTSTWSATSGGLPGASVPGKNDNVYIENTHIVEVTENYQCSSIIFTGASATLIISSPATLTVKSSVTLNKLTNLDSECYVTGTGILECSEVVVGSATNPPPSGPGSSVYTHTFTSNLALLNISLKGAPNNDITINSYIGGTGHLRNGIFNIEGGTVSVEGQVSTNNDNAANTSFLSMAVGPESGTLNLLGRSNPFYLSASGTTTINLNGSASLVNYSMTAAQTVLATEYNNLTLSGSGAKTLTGATINGILSLEGTTSSAGTTPSFGPLSTIQYMGSSAQTTGIEFPSTFSGSGGIIVSNSAGVTLNGNREVLYALTFLNGKINTGTYFLTLGSSSVVTGAAAGKYINGNLQKVIAGGTPSKIFEIGDASVYAPVEIQFTGSVTSEGTITLSTTTGDHPNIATSTFMTGVTVNRYWTISNSGVSGFISYSATFNYVPGDIDSGADYVNFYVGNFDSSTWTYPTVGTKASTSTQATGLTVFGDFQVGELPIASFRSKTTGDWNLVSTWESFDGTAWTDASSTPSSASGFINIRSSHTVTNTGILTTDQLIIEAGGILVLGSTLTINDGPGIDVKVNGTLDCSNNIITGSGSFLLDNGADLIIFSNEGITSSGTSGDIQTTTRTFMPWANYTYNGTSSQVTGNGLPASVNNLTINNAGGVSLSGSLNINGILTLDEGVFSIGSNTLTFETSDTPIARTSGTITTSTDSNLAFGTQLNMTGDDFTIPDGSFTAAPEINNLTVYRTNTLTLNNQVLSIRGILLCNGPLNTNGNLTLASGPTFTALIDGSGTGEVSNEVTMQRYVPSAYGYKYVSSPFQASTVNEFADDLDLAASFPTFYRYNEASTASGWIEYITTTEVLNPLEGYAANFGSSPVPATADVTGIVNNGPLSITLYNHNNTYTLGFNLVGNPYPSPIDWDALSGWTKTNIDNALYYFKASTTDEYAGTYSTYINGVSSDGIATGIIPSMQGFFVHVSDGSYPVTGILGLDNNVRVNDLTHPFTKSGSSSHPSIIRLVATMGNYTSSSDPLVVYFDENAETGFDSQLDAIKLMNTDYFVPNLYSFGSDDSKLSINSLPWCYEDVCSIPLGLKLNIDGYISFRIQDIGEKLTGQKIFISDIITGTEQDMLSNNEYKVYLTRGEYNKRFFLNISSIATQIPETEHEAAEDSFYAYSANGILKTYVNTIITGPGILTITNLTGQVLFTERIVSEGYNEFIPGLQEGIYVVTFNSGKYRSSKKILIHKR